MVYKIKSLKSYFLLILFSLVVQVTLGIFNVIYLLPIYNAVLHNGFALLLLTFLVLSLSRIKSFIKMSHIFKELNSLILLTKPRVIFLIVFTAIIGMLLSSPNIPSPSLLIYSLLVFG